MHHDLYLSLGSNLGDRAANIRTALSHIDDNIGTVYRVATPVHSQPDGYSSPNPYLNTVCLVHTMMNPQRVLREIEKIEVAMGRRHKTTYAPDGTPRYTDRIIDIDILLYDHLTIHTPLLTIPHPRMYQRDFVMQPLREIQES